MHFLRNLITIKNITFVVSIFFTGYLVYYFLTGRGGPMLLATRLVPFAVILAVLNTYLRGGLYPGLSQKANKIILAVYIVISLICFVYWFIEFENIYFVRSGVFSTADLIIGSLMLILILELSRVFHIAIFCINLVLVAYAFLGPIMPIDFFWHPGLTFTRFLSSTSVELSDGIYGRYSQIGFTYIAAFLLLAAVAKGFGAQESILRVIYSFFGKHTYNIPLVAVVSSAAIGSTSGSGAANTAVTGSFTIPLMKKHGINPVYAAAVETAASMGGTLLPPLMAVAGFLMAEYLGVPYWDVVIRGFGIAGIYFISLYLVVHLLSVSEIVPYEREVQSVEQHETAKALSFFASIIFLIVLMGYYGYGPMRAGVYGATFLAGLLLLIFFYYKYIKKAESFSNEKLTTILRDVIETHSDLVWYMIILLATLGILISLFTVTGFMIRMGSLIMALGGVSIILTILAAWAFGWIAGTGLPPTATYIIVAVVVAPPMARLGVNPWVVHFFIFLVAIWGELSPPTSLTAAVASRLAETSFMRTMLEALKICSPILIMSFAIFVRSDAVVSTGLPQLFNIALILIGTLATSFSFFGVVSTKHLPNIGYKLVILFLSLIVLFYPSDLYATIIALILLVLIIFGVLRHRKVVVPKALRKKKKNDENSDTVELKAETQNYQG